MGGAKFVIAGGLVAAGLLVGPATVRADDQAVVLCGEITDAASAGIRAGRVDEARVLKPFLDRCAPILKARMDRAIDALRARRAPQ
ncbi:hypothetical protein [Rhodopseudomonas palustris]|uniref:Uncharacterized protein n=1 Tax=Rhodopseudomonas palustris TaxID=1076 RepID=A0A418V458_RHOPL|nr:hypothetical protein [Rhodopseudomonas palustris]RJF70909.1 hypothetical protein D4Q52_14870 [Rhodopseudomonas palustris]